MKPFLMKPNHHELGEMFETSISSAEEAIPYGKKLLEQGAEHVIVSMAGDGALYSVKKESISPMFQRERSLIQLEQEIQSLQGF